MRPHRSLLLVIPLLLVLLLSGCCARTAGRDLTRMEATLEAILRGKPLRRTRLVTRVPRPATVEPAAQDVTATPAGSEATAATAQPVATPEVPDGWVLFAEPTEGFALALPSTWQRLDPQSEDLQASIEAMAELNPEIRSLLQDVARKAVASGARFLAIDLRPERWTSGFTTNVNIVKEPWAGQGSLADAVEEGVAQLESMPNVIKPVTHEPFAHPAGEAERTHLRMTLTMPDGRAKTMAMTQYVLLVGRVAYVLSFATSESQAQEYEPVFQQAALSFRLLP